MGFCSKVLTLVILGTAIFIAFKHEEILKYAVDNYEICPKPEAPPQIEVKVVNRNDDKKEDTSDKSAPAKKKSYDSPKYWLIGDNVDEDLSTVSAVLDRCGLERHNGSLKEENNHEGWNLIWSTKKTIAMNWKELKYHQKFNHFPWSKYLSSKSYLATNTDSKYVPKGFVDSDELKSYAKENPKKKFLKKSKTRGGVSYVKNVNKMNFTSDEEYFVQELVEKPLLFDGKLFELSVFVLITSVNPLRLYYFPKNVVPRFCPEDYDHQDFSDEDSFVVSESHQAPLDFLGTREYFLNAYTFRDAINGFLTKQNKNVDTFWKNIEDAIRTTVVSKEKSFLDLHEKIQEMKYMYFELYSFEFIIDESLNPHIININANPDISGSGKYARFRSIYENLLYNVFQIIGVATPYVKKDFIMESVELEMMVVHANARNVMPEFCIYDCEGGCSGKCAYCMRCMNQNQFYETVLAYTEQQNVGGFKRLFPPSKEFLAEAGEEYVKSLPDHSQFQVGWYVELCKRDQNFC
ncbi:hypothetical protein ACKWTF_014719 [Chironomus riparius]